MTDERMQFVARRLAGETMAELCREFGISRKTGYKIFDRYPKCGIHGLTDRPSLEVKSGRRISARKLSGTPTFGM